MSKCNNLRLAETCETCRYVVSRWDYDGGYDFLYYCNVDGDAPADPDQVLGGSVDESLEILDAWDAWATKHSRYAGNTCDAWKPSENVKFSCFGTYGVRLNCLECKQASLPRETPELDVPFAGEGDADEVS